MVLKCLHGIFYHKIEKQVGQRVSKINENTNDSIAIIIDLQRVHLMDCLTDCLMGCLMGCLMVGSKVLQNKVHHQIEERIEDKKLVICYGNIKEQ